MGYAMVIGTCYQCRKQFSFNPKFVPSLRVRGEKVPFCRECVMAANIIRQEKGMSQLIIHPEAYEPLDERELP